MYEILLNEDQLKRIGIYPAPNVEGFNSIFFHPLTRNSTPKVRKEFGLRLTIICEDEGIPYYYFYNDNDEKINVFPNFLIEKEWTAQKSKI